MTDDARPTPSQEGSLRITITIPAGQTLNRLRRVSEASGMSLSRTIVRAMTRGLSDTAQTDDRLLKLEQRLSSHMRAASRDAMIQQELMVATARMLLIHAGWIEQETEASAVRADAMIDRLLAHVLAQISAGRIKGQLENASPVETM
jgi:hypothetical protein